MEGGDASNGAGTGTEIDEVGGGLRALPSGWLEPGGGGGGSGCLGAHLPALARPLRGGGSRRSLRPPPRPPLGAARAGGRGGAGLELFDTRYWDFTASTSTRSWWPITASSAATTAAAVASPWATRGAQAAPAQAARRAMPGMMLHQTARATSGSRWWGCTMDDAEVVGLLRRREGTSRASMSEEIRAKGLFCSLYGSIGVEH